MASVYSAGIGFPVGKPFPILEAQHITWKVDIILTLDRFARSQMFKMTKLELVTTSTMVESIGLDLGAEFKC